MMILSSRGVVQSMNWVRANADDPNILADAEKAKKAFVGRELKGKRVGVVGLGNVGSKVANALVDLGMDVYGYDPFISVEHAWALSQNVQRVGTLEDLCRGCDYLTLHVPSKADTKGMISTEQLALLAPGAVLINYARETIIDEDAVHAALESGKLSWFAGDFATPKTVLMPNTFITTHSGAVPARRRPTARTWPSPSSRTIWKTATSPTPSTTPPATWVRRAPLAASHACTPTCPT